MQVSSHYSRAPITEAIIDFRVTLPEGISVDVLADIHARINAHFPTKEPIYTNSVVLQAELDSSIVDTSHQHSGFLFRSGDKLNIFQATLNGFTFNRLAPYESWEKFRNDARYVWEIYKDICKPVNMTRAAIRFINRLDLPGSGVELKDYLRTVPEVAPDLPQGLSGFFMQLQIPQEDLNCMLIINETFVPPNHPNLVSVMLDFELFCNRIWRSDDEEVWHFLEKLRYRKNLVFEASITDNTRRLIA